MCEALYLYVALREYQRNFNHQGLGIGHRQRNPRDRLRDVKIGPRSGRVSRVKKEKGPRTNPASFATAGSTLFDGGNGKTDQQQKQRCDGDRAHHHNSKKILPRIVIVRSDGAVYLTRASERPQHSSGLIEK